ncbi:MAG: acetate--CoA ligase family protein [Microgenomates group bacterium]
MEASQLSSVFSPTSVALVGASAKAGSVGNNLMKNLVGSGFKGVVYPVNPTSQTIEGIASVSSITAIGSPIDLAIIAVRADLVRSVVEEAGKCGVKGLIIISAGFREAGVEGKKREEEIKALCEKYNMMMIGPNCLGVLHPSLGLNASFAPLMPKAGSIAFISQSGALGTAVIDFARDLDIGFSTFISMGNKATVDEVALITYFQHDPETKVILMYVEDIRDAAAFVAIAKKVTHGEHAKPIIFLKAGRTKAGANASVSHTGALGGNDAYYDAVALESGAIRVNTIQELFSDALMFAHNPLPKGNRVVIITNAGGPGVLMTDTAVLSGLTMATLEETTITKLREVLPMCANCVNPIDVLGDAKSDRYSLAFDAIAKDIGVDSFLILLTPQAGTEIIETAQKIIELKENIDKPIGVSFVGGPLVAPGMALLRSKNVAAFSYPEDASKALATLTQFALATKKLSEEVLMSFLDIQPEKVITALAPFGSQKKELIPEELAHEILRLYGFLMLHSARVQTRDALTTAMEQFVGEVAMKIVSPDITHKSDVGGVLLNVTKSTALASYDTLMQTVSSHVPNAKLEGVLLVEMAPTGGMEIILGISKQQGFGTMVMVGLGGIYVEAFKDVSFGVVPVTEEDAMGMINRLRIHTILDGVRGKPAMDKKLLATCIQRLSKLVSDHPEIVELDINPFVLLVDGGKVLDARIAVEHTSLGNK